MAAAADDFPPEVWRGCLNFLAYGDARPVFLVNKMARDSTQCIETLTILEVKELQVSTTRRFPNLLKVNIWCLVDVRGDDESDISLSPDAVDKTAPFLVALQQHTKLRRASIGGFGPPGRPYYFYDMFLHFHYHFDYSLYCRLIFSIRGAFSLGVLDIDFEFDEVEGGRSVSLVECASCQAICQAFPFSLASNRGLNLCTSRAHQYYLIAQRPGGRKFLASPDRFLGIFIKDVLCDNIVPSFISANGMDQVRRYAKYIETGTQVMFFYYQKDDLDEMELLLIKNEYGCSPERLSKADIVRSIISYYREDYVEEMIDIWPFPFIIAKVTHDRLISIGFDLLPDDFAHVLDDTREGDDEVRQLTQW